MLDESSVVLTYMTPSKEPASALVETDSLLLLDIELRGKHIYKSHLHEGRVFHSVRATGERYGMSIPRNSYALEPSTVRVLGSPWM